MSTASSFFSDIVDIVSWTGHRDKRLSTSVREFLDHGLRSHKDWGPTLEKKEEGAEHQRFPFWFLAMGYYVTCCFTLLPS